MKTRLAVVITALTFIITSCWDGPIARVLDIDPPYELETGVALDTPASGSIDTDVTTPTGSYPEDTQVTALAVPGSGNLFSGWLDAAEDGQFVSSDNPFSVQLTDDLALYARFYTPRDLSVGTSADGDGSGVIVPSLADGTYESGTEFTVIGNPTLGSKLAGWYDAESGGALLSTNNPAAFTLDSDLEIYGRFDQALIAFMSDRDLVLGENASREIYTVLPDGSNVTRLTNNSVEDKDPAWNKSRTRLAFAWRDSGAASNFETYTCNSSGGAVVPVTSSSGDEHNYQPDWSFDGTQIAYTKFETSRNQVWVMDASGASQDRITDSTANEAVASWSPDGNKIAFMSTRPSSTGTIFDIWAMDSSDGGNLDQLTTNGADDRNPVWSPDGMKILFQTKRDGTWQIYTMDTDGGSKLNLSDNAVNDQWPDWSADGGQIIFQSDRDGPEAIYMMWADGSEQTKITDDTGNDYKPNW